MLRVLLLLGLLAANVIQSFAQSSFEFPVLKGKVKTCTEICFKALKRNDSIVAGAHKKENQTNYNYTIHYDSIGRITRRDELDIFGDKIIRKHLYSYNAEGYAAEQSIIAGRGSMIKDVKYYYQFNEHRKLIRQKTISSDHPDTLITIYVYQGNYKVSESKLCKDTQETLPYRCFDSAGRVTKQWEYNLRGKLLGYYEMKYDSTGNLIEQKVFDAHGKNYMIYSWKYLPAGYPERYEIREPGSNNFEAWTYRYEYDTSGNWVKRIDYRNGKPVYIREREIIYY